MNDFDVFSRNIQELVGQEKFEDALIQFEDMIQRFNTTEIAENPKLIRSLLKSYKKVSRPMDGLAFVDKLSIDIVSLNDKYILSTYGWLLYAALKSSQDLKLSESENLVQRIIDFLPSINVKDDFNTRLVRYLFQQIIELERKKSPPKVDKIFQILKAIKIREIEEAKELVKDDPYLVSGILTILRKSNQLGRAFSFLNFLEIEINQATATQIVDAYGWMVYSKVKAENQAIDEDQPDESFDSLLYELDHRHMVISNQENCNETNHLVIETFPLLDPKSKYGAFSRLFRLVIKSEKHRPNTNWRYLYDFIKLINPDTLSQKCETIEFDRKGKKKKMELASDKEVWYAAFTQVLMELGQYKECITLSNASLEIFDRFHHGNDVWFARKIAKCQRQLGNIPDALKEMEEIELRKSEWFIQKELAELYFEQNEITKAKRMATKAALNYGDKEKKDGVYFLLGQINKHQGQKEIAYKHFLLSQLIREEEDWKIPQKLKEELKETKPQGFTCKYESAIVLYKELLKFWKGSSSSFQLTSREQKTNSKVYYGKIKYVNHGKGFGFLVGANENEYFFRSNANKASFSALQNGLKVKFKCSPPKVLEAGKKWNAYDIVILK